MRVVNTVAICMALLGATSSMAEQTDKFSAIGGIVGGAYDKVNPYYAKYCSTTQYNPKEGKGLDGGTGGHALIYLKGVCRDRKVGPSGLKLCDESMDFTSPETGVGLSVDKGLKNVNFFVIPGARLFLAGNVYADEAFSSDTKTRLINEMVATNILEGIEFHDNMIPRTLMKEDYEEFLARYTFGTDYAVSMARNMYCINIPMPKKVMGSVVENLNELNASYKKSAGESFRGVILEREKKDNDYHWNGIFDNCTHTIINLFAKLGVLKPKKINSTFFRQIWNIAVPANTLLDLHERNNEDSIDVEEYWDDKVKRRTFQRFKWIPQQEGNLVEYIRVFKDNKVYENDQSMFVLPKLGSKRNKKIRNLINEYKFTYHKDGMKGLIPNYLEYSRKYNRALQDAQKLMGKRKYKKAAKQGSRQAIAEVKAKIDDLKKQSMMSGVSRKQLKSINKELKKRTEELGERMSHKEYKDFVDDFAAYLENKIKTLRIFTVSHFDMMN